MLRFARITGAAGWIGIFPLVFVTGCGLVFGISSGEYDPDPFGRDGGGRADGSPSHDPDGSSGRDGSSDTPSCKPELLDDLEDGNAEINPCDGRRGSWYTYNDGTAGAQTPAPGSPFLPVNEGANGSKRSAYVKGSGFNAPGAVSGAGMGFNLNKVGATRATYNAGKYLGIRFRVKGKVDKGVIYLNIRDKSRDPAGGVCQGANNCNNLFGSSVDVKSDWTDQGKSFSDMTPDGPATSERVDKEHIYAVEFHAAKEQSFEFWIDDVEFF